MSSNCSSGTNPAAHRHIRCAAVVGSGGCGLTWRRAACGPSRGFTLVELLLVASILTILAAIAAPRYAASLNRYRIESAASRIVADVAAARATARAQSASVVIEFHASGYGIAQMRAVDGNASYRISFLEAPYSLRGFKWDFPGPDRLTFDGYGSLDQGGIILLGLGALERSIVIDHTTGEARIQR